MTIGEQIIAAIERDELCIEDRRSKYSPETRCYCWAPEAPAILDAMVDAHIAERVKAKIEEIAESIGWRREGSLWRDPVDGKRWAWTTDDLMREMTARLLVKPDAGGS